MVSEKDPYDVIGRIARRIRASDQARRDWACARILADGLKRAGHVMHIPCDRCLDHTINACPPSCQGCDCACHSRDGG